MPKTSIPTDQIDAGIDAINVRSEELQEVIGKIPHWIIRWGITIIFSALALLLIGSWIFRYPDIVSATILVTSKNPPATLVARVRGKIQHLLVEDNQLVNKGDYICVLENTANLQHVLGLKKKLADFQEYVDSFNPGSLDTFSRNEVLGDLQNPYEVFLKSLADYLHYLQLNYYPKKLLSLEQQLIKQNIYSGQLATQIVNLEEELKLAQNQYNRAESLFKEGIISRTDLENAKSAYLQKKDIYNTAETNLTQAKIQTNTLEQGAMDLQFQDAQQKKQMQLALKQNYNNLLSAILQWEYSYVLISPVSGKVSFTKFWIVNQNVVEGEKVVSIVPQEETGMIGRILLPLQGSGKIKVGQKVRIMFANYPYMEFGLVWGEIRSKSLVPVDNFYTLEVILPQGLKTSYGKTLEFSLEMQGTAEIITQNKRLIERLLSPFKMLFSQSRGS
jgi:HlyD family secretion protein